MKDEKLSLTMNDIRFMRYINNRELIPFNKMPIFRQERQEKKKKKKPSVSDTVTPQVYLSLSYTSKMKI